MSRREVYSLLSGKPVLVSREPLRDGPREFFELDQVHSRNLQGPWDDTLEKARNQFLAENGILPHFPASDKDPTWKNIDIILSCSKCLMPWLVKHLSDEEVAKYAMRRQRLFPDLCKSDEVLMNTHGDLFSVNEPKVADKPAAKPGKSKLKRLRHQKSKAKKAAASAASAAAASAASAAASAELSEWEADDAIPSDAVVKCDNEEEVCMSLPSLSILSKSRSFEYSSITPSNYGPETLFKKEEAARLDMAELEQIEEEIRREDAAAEQAKLRVDEAKCKVVAGDVKEQWGGDEAQEKPEKVFASKVKELVEYGDTHSSKLKFIKADLATLQKFIVLNNGGDALGPVVDLRTRFKSEAADPAEFEDGLETVYDSRCPSCFEPFDLACKLPMKTNCGGGKLDCIFCAMCWMGFKRANLSRCMCGGPFNVESFKVDSAWGAAC